MFLILVISIHTILKHLISLLLVFVSYRGFSQDGNLPLDSHKQVYYSDRGKLEKSQEEIYKKAQKWVIKTFANYDQTAPGQGPETGKLVINSYVPVSHSIYDYIRFDLTIDCKDQAYESAIDKLDGTSAIRTPIRLSSKDNDAVLEKAVTLKTETNKKKKAEAEQILEAAKADNEAVNSAMYNLLASLKEFMINETEK